MKFWSRSPLAAAGAASTWLGGPNRASLLLGLAYTAFGIAWIYGSDRLLFGLSSEPSVLQVLGSWKGVFFVVLSALWVVVVSRREHRTAAGDRAPAQLLDSGVVRRRLFAVLALTSAAIVSVGVTGAVNASRGTRLEVADMLRVIVTGRTAIWEVWIRERQLEASAHRHNAELLQALHQWRRDGDESSRKRIEAGLLMLCLPPHCLEARLLDETGRPVLSSQAPDTPALVGRIERALRWSAQEAGAVELDANSPETRPLPVDIVVPLSGSPGGARAAVVLRFDARPTLQRLLRNDAVAGVDGLRIVMARQDGGSNQLIEAGADGRLRIQRDADLQLPAWPDSRPGESAAVRSVQVTRADGGALFGSAAMPQGMGWSLAAVVGGERLDQRAWSHVLWTLAANLAVLTVAALAVFGLQQRRELLAARRERAQQDEKLRALRLLDAIANGTPDIIFAKDLAGRFIFANQATCDALGQPAAALLGSRADAYLPAAEAAQVEALHAEVLAAGHALTSESELTTAAGRRCYLRTLGPLREADGRISGTFGVVRDVTERKHQQERQRQWAKAFESTRDGVIICDARGLIQSVNHAFTEITGYTPDEALGQTPALLHSGRHDDDFYRALWRGLADCGHWQGEIWNRRKNGEVYPEWLTISAVRDDQGGLANYVGVFTDITRVKHGEAELQRLANYDPLTELPNRRLLMSRLGQALAQTQRHGGRTALLYIDLDGFKTVNDGLGHPAGDELLVRVAQRLQARLRAEDSFGRLGGDEFLVILEDLQAPDEAAALAQDLLDVIAQPVPLAGGREAYVTASIGISLYPDDGCSDAIAMMRDADAAMYRAKEQGRNRFCFYTQDLNLQAMARLETEAALSRALQRGELLLHYQPKYDARGGRIVGAEALLRWQRDGELVPPGRFIPLAEQSSLILDIGAWVIDEACRQLRAWRDQGLAMPRIAVNVAARQFAAGNLDQVVRAALQRHGVPAAGLELELTESMLLERPAEAVAMLHRLKDIGVQLSLDDFGTGYSSLAYLRQFPIDALKIDKSFVDQIGEGENGSAIVDAVIALAHRLGLGVVAEGVETEAQRLHLQRQGCDELQGFGLSRPLPVLALQALCAAPG